MTLSHACPEFSDRLVDLSDGELPSSERRAVEEHSAGCPGCREELARLNQSLSRLQAAICSSQPIETTPRQRVSMSAVAAAVATIAALIVTGVFLMSRFDGRSARESAPVGSQAESLANVPTTPVPAVVAPKLSASEALWRIALNEQEARLQTSLELLPRDERDGDQRRDTEEIVERIRQAATTQGANL